MVRGAAPIVGSLVAIAVLGARTASAEPCGVILGRGEARASSTSAWTPLVVGAKAPLRGEIRATQERLRFCAMKGTEIDLAPGTTIVVRGDTRVALDAQTRVTALDVALGEGEIAIDASPSMWHGPLRKPVAVRGPRDMIALDWGGGTRVRLLPPRGALPAGILAGSIRGDVMVSGQKTMRQIHAGFAVELRAGATMGEPRPLAPAPTWSAHVGPNVHGPIGLVASSAGKARVAAPFDPVPSAVGYDAEIAQDADFKHVIARRSLGAFERVVTTPPLPAGRYFVRVSARGAEGLPGVPSAPRALRVERISLPKGGALLGGLVVLPRNRTLTWADPEGLEIALGARAFARATPELGLEGGDGQVVARVRLAGDGSYLPLVIAPQVLKAEIDLGPKTATWPRDPVWVTVRMASPSEPEPLYDPVLRVTVNLREVPVTWTRERNVLRATLPPREGPGPWTVRVEARDQRGKELGFGLLEVIRGKEGGRQASR
jgi:hypothetical protein